MRKIDQSIAAIPSEPVREALIALLHNAQGDAVAFRRNVEQWYDDQMERVSGWYRRRIQKVLWILAFVVAFTLNADALQMAKRLWVEPSVRDVARQPGGHRAPTSRRRTPTRRRSSRRSPSRLGGISRARATTPKASRSTRTGR